MQKIKKQNIHFNGSQTTFKSFFKQDFFFCNILSHQVQESYTIFVNV